MAVTRQEDESGTQANNYSDKNEDDEELHDVSPRRSDEQ